MDFFESQDRARRRTGLLVLMLALAVILTILAVYLVLVWALSTHAAIAEPGESTVSRRHGMWQPDILIGVGILVTAVVSLGSLYKWMQLRGGGPAVAEMMGGRLVSPESNDPAERRLLNVVEEMSIASGSPVPAVYVLDREPAINAFAAGFTRDDAVVAVTRGTLEKLDRDEIQGVIAHEFSHILNGDMRLNLRLIAIIFGILAIGLIGRTLLRGVFYARIGRARRDGRAVAVAATAGLILMAIGYIGYLFGRLIQAAISRQREFLADSAAVQFTRNSAGISGALKKIGGYALGSRLADPHAVEAGHLCFGQAFGARSWNPFATHPPLERRIRALDPSFDGKYYEPPTIREPKAAPPPAPKAAARSIPIPQVAAIPLVAAAAVAAVGAPTASHIDHARDVLEKLPDRLRDAARSPAEVSALIAALLFDDDADVKARQQNLLAAELGSDTATLARELRLLVDSAGTAARLPLLEIAAPALRQLPPDLAEALRKTAAGLIAANKEVSLFEFALEKALERHLPGRRVTPAGGRIHSFSALDEEIGLLLSSLAQTGGSGDEAHRSFAAARNEVKIIQDRIKLTHMKEISLDRLNGALQRMDQAALPIKKRFLLAATAAVIHDGKVTTDEAELLRAMADAIDCPMPPVFPAEPEKQVVGLQSACE